VASQCDCSCSLTGAFCGGTSSSGTGSSRVILSYFLMYHLRWAMDPLRVQFHRNAVSPYRKYTMLAFSITPSNGEALKTVIILFYYIFFQFILGSVNLQNKLMSDWSPFDIWFYCVQPHYIKCTLLFTNNLEI
jgi:hypothetical protein